MNCLYNILKNFWLFLSASTRTLDVYREHHQEHPMPIFCGLINKLCHLANINIISIFCLVKILETLWNYNILLLYSLYKEFLQPLPLFSSNNYVKEFQTLWYKIFRGIFSFEGVQSLWILFSNIINFFNFWNKQN